MDKQIVRCVSCDGYGWFEDEETFEPVDCDWCQGTGYVYRDASGVDSPIPEADYGRVAAQLERLEQERMREMGYTGSALHPDEQPIRRGETPDAQDND
ncbi:MAG: hypothetical protein ACOCXZ_03700 [Chloroflexota bacterium]